MSVAAVEDFDEAPAPSFLQRRIYRGVHMSSWAWRQRVRGKMLDFATSELPRGKVRRDWKAKAHAFAGCGRTLSALACQGCENINLASGTIVATCGLRICPICARRKAQKLRHRLRHAWDTQPRHRRHGLYFLTFTMRYDPTNAAEVSAEGLLRRKTELLTAWGSIWRQYLKPLAPKDEGGAACRAIEVGSSGMVHLHVLFKGRRPSVDELRLRWLHHAPTSPIVNVRYCKNPGKAIVELAKYVTKGASPAKLDVVAGAAGGHMDPELAVAVEIAFSGDRLVQCYGAWLGITVDDDEDTPEEVLSEKALHGASCQCCGLVGEWHTRNFTLDEWFEKFGGDLEHWKPRIGGAGPRKREGDEHANRKPKAQGRDWSGAAVDETTHDGRSLAGKRERAEHAAELAGDPAARERDTLRRGLPAWCAHATRVDTTGGQCDET